MLTRQDLDMLITSMGYTMRNIENYTGYPSYEFKMQQINEAQSVVNKLRAMRKSMKEQTSGQPATDTNRQHRIIERAG